MDLGSTNSFAHEGKTKDDLRGRGLDTGGGFLDLNFIFAPRRETNILKYRTQKTFTF